MALVGLWPRKKMEKQKEKVMENDPDGTRLEDARFICFFLKKQDNIGKTLRNLS